MTVQAAEVTFATTIQLPATLRAQLDEVRANRTRRNGKRPSTNELLVEAVRELVVREAQIEDKR